jgi:hypothetical protein
VDTSTKEVGVAAVAAMGILLTATLIAIRTIWLIATEPEAFAVLLFADSMWSVVIGLAARLVAIT